MIRFVDIFPSPKAIIGVVHLPPLPGFDGHPGIPALVAHALADLDVLAGEAVDGVLVENEYDRPHQVTASPEAIAAMTEITRSVVSARRNIVAGCEILLNDPRASLQVAAASGARFIRSDYFVDRMSRPGYGEFHIDPEGLIRHRNRIAAGVLILADIQVKYASMLEPRPLAESARLASLCGADAVVVTGSATGDAPRLDHLQEAATGVAASGNHIPVLIGSGLTAANARKLLDACDGAIVGTALMRNGKVDAHATAALMSEVRKLRAS
ncbi:MAG: BtpA/SgcQ family protein [Woeseiaceae bacterium]|nr:BtpA/SgcQ family protein [Woeseiaceae bacterium]